jgi:hypothetical protein
MVFDRYEELLNIALVVTALGEIPFDLFAQISVSIDVVKEHPKHACVLLDRVFLGEQREEVG